MAGVAPIVPPRSGSTDGKLEIQTERFITPDELIAYSLTAKAFIDELSERGWRYYFIDSHGKVALELGIDSAAYTFQTYEHPRGGFAYALSMDFGRRLPKLQLKNIIDLDRFVLNICSKDYPRGVTIDLIKNEITYVHESLWVSKGEGCTEEARDVLKILQWLIEEKEFKLAVGDGEKYRELVNLLGEK